LKKFLNEKKSDFLIIGAGIIGLAIAKELVERYPNKKIQVIEKESDVAYHSSGRNSGVLHAGFYYTSDSLKAKFTREGNLALTNYCIKNNLSINQCKKVVVAQNEEELEGLYELYKRGKANGVDVSILNKKELFDIDSNVKTFEKALYSPTTSTVDPVEICNFIKKELISSGVEFSFNTKYLSFIDSISHTDGVRNIIKIKHQKNFIQFSVKKIINTAGLYADKIAKDFGFCQHYEIIPFKGIYLKYKGSILPVSTNVYPVPNLENPFLGVHYTVTVDNIVKIGPTAIPAFWRENYKGLSNFNLLELTKILSKEAKLFILNSFGFRKLAFEEVRKYRKKYFINLAAGMLKKIDKVGFNQWSKPGIRAQLIDKRTNEFVQDFVVEADENSVHVLNAVSPAFTSSFPFAKWIVDKYIEAVK